MPSLNPEQAAAAAHVEGPAIVNSLAGTGKTETITSRIVALVEAGVDPARILAVTFSRAGGEAMNTRLRKRLGKTAARVGTFHSLALEILRAEVPEYAKWDIKDGAYRMCIKTAVGWEEMGWKEADVSVCEQYVSLCMCALAMPGTPAALKVAEDLYARRKKSDAIPKHLMRMYERAEEIRKDRQFLTFDVVLAEATLLLLEDEGVRRRVASRWDYVIADEQQDSNKAQNLIGRLLAELHRNLMVVGDEFQRIYGWRGAEVESLVGLKTEWGAKTYTLFRNYRCGDSILAAANMMLKSMGATSFLKGERGVNGVVTGTLFFDFDAEARSIAGRIADSRGVRKLSDYAVLYRTAAQSRALEEAFLAARIPYRITSGTNFYERTEVADLLSYLRVIAPLGDPMASLRCLNRPFRFLGKAFLSRVEAALGAAGSGDPVATVRAVSQQPGVQSRQAESAESWCVLVAACRARMEKAASSPSEVVRLEGSPASILEHILTRTDYVKWLTREEGDESVENSRVSNVRELVRVATKFETVSDFLAFIDETIAAAKEAARTNAEVDAVTLSTVHRAKGLEWPVVFVIGVNAGILPHARAEDPSEEGRLYYVALTRARDELHVSAVRSAVVSGKVRPLTPSHFLGLSGIVLVDADAAAIEAQGVGAT